MIDEQKLRELVEHANLSIQKRADMNEAEFSDSEDKRREFRRTAPDAILALLDERQSLRSELAALKSSLSEPVDYEWRWLNPAGANVHQEETEWKKPVPKNLESIEEFVNRLLVYRYGEKPVYEVRPLYAIKEPT